MRSFYQVLANTAVANVTSSYLWWALTFWAYLETRSVLATSIIGGSYMLLVAVFGFVFGAIVEGARAGLTNEEICTRLRRDLGFGQPLVVV